VPCKQLKHLYNVEKRYYSPQAFLSLDIHCKMAVSVKYRCFGIEKSCASSKLYDSIIENACTAIAYCKPEACNQVTSALRRLCLAGHEGMQLLALSCIWQTNCNEVMATTAQAI